MEDSKEIERLKTAHNRLKRMLVNLTREDKKKDEKQFVKNYIKDWKPRMKYIIGQRAKRQYEVFGLGFCRAAGVYGFNLMDEILDVYVDGHYLACIALCRSRTELVLREYIYFQWFLDNKKKEIQKFLDDWVKPRIGHDDDYMSNGVKFENLTNRLVFQYFEDEREKMDSELNSLTSNRGLITNMTLGGLINYCETKKYFDKLFLRKLKKMKDEGNYFVHNHHIKPKPSDSISFGRPNYIKEPRKSTVKLIRLTTYFMNNIFGDYPYKTPRPKENLFRLNIPIQTNEKKA